MTSVIVLLSAGGVLLTLAVLTTVGERRRGGRFAVTVLAGLFFPLAWVAWYVRDELRTC